MEERYHQLWAEITTPWTAVIGDTAPIAQRIERLRDLGFDIDEMEVVTEDDDVTVQVTPRVVEHGFHAERLANLTGLQAGENQARRMLDDIRSYAAFLRADSDRPIPFNVAAVRWLDRVFEPVLAAVPPELLDRLEAAEIFHQLLEHRWYMAERLGRDVTLLEALDDYRDVLAEAPSERLQMEELTSADDVDPVDRLPAAGDGPAPVAG